MLGVIFRKAQNRIEDPAKLRRWIAPMPLPANLLDVITFVHALRP